MLNSQVSGEKNQEKKCQRNSGRDKEQRMRSRFQFFGLSDKNQEHRLRIKDQDKSLRTSRGL